MLHDVYKLLDLQKGSYTHPTLQLRNFNLLLSRVSINHAQSYAFLTLFTNLAIYIPYSTKNFGWVNFWRLVGRHAIGGEKFGKSSITSLSRIVNMVMFKNLAGKILTGLHQSTCYTVHMYNLVMHV